MNPIQTEPKNMVAMYYTALEKGDMKQLKQVMTEESYFMTLES